MAAPGPSTPVSAPMEIDFDVCQSSDCSSFDVTDTTGIYSSGNPGGYGLPNFAISDAIDARLYVTLPNGIQVIFTVFPTLPDSTGASVFNVTNIMLGYGGSLPDGVYVIEYQIDFNNANSQTAQYQSTKTILLSCSIKCCVDKLIAKIAVSNCSCDDSAVQTALLAFALYQSLLNSGKCGNLTNVANILARLQRMCGANNCNCNN